MLQQEKSKLKHDQEEVKEGQEKLKEGQRKLQQGQNKLEHEQEEVEELKDKLSNVLTTGQGLQKRVTECVDKLEVLLEKEIKVIENSPQWRKDIHEENKQFVKEAKDLNEEYKNTLNIVNDMLDRAHNNGIETPYMP